MHPPEEPMKRQDIRLYQEFGIIKTCRSEHTHMQPLFAHNLLLLSVLLASLLIWRVMEASVDIRTLKRLRAGIQRQDKGSHVVLLCLVVFGILLGVLLAFRVPVTAITSASVFLFWLGILLIYAGIALRLYAITV